MEKIKSMQLNEFKILNRKNGFHFFDKETIKFFKSKILNWSETGYFISSEINPEGIKGYTIRKAQFKTGNVKTISRFMEFSSIEDAKTTMKKLINSEND